MKSTTKIKKQLKRKRNPLLIKTIKNLIQDKKWASVVTYLSYPRRKRIVWNLDEINEISKDGECIIVPGKVLSKGEINKKVKIVALNFSKKAREKLLASKIEFSTFIEEIKKIPKEEQMKVLAK